MRIIRITVPCVRDMLPGFEPIQLGACLDHFVAFPPKQSDAVEFIEVDFLERTENLASGIFGLVRDSHVYKGNYAKHHCKFVFSEISKILFSDRYVHCVFVAPFVEV